MVLFRFQSIPLVPYTRGNGLQEEQLRREIIAGVIKDSYGRKAQQHTFTIVVLGSSGDYSLDVGTKTTRKGRNIYRNGTKRCPWTNEEMREIALTEKHSRGDKARRDRERRYSEKLL